MCSRRHGPADTVGARSPRAFRGPKGLRVLKDATGPRRAEGPLRALPEQASAGPVPYDGGYLAGAVHEVVPPDPEAPEVLEAARDAAFRAWLDERRRTSEVRWFWL
ncbi:hypothetical protein AB0L65_12735 [Nonomuraea sp. NPDC052116]|uniref:hypothetical protein n=1 Tax=Nonomuraea sp. NPDC052116 TaxID=3155665 RepID=UPI0034120F09